MIPVSYGYRNLFVRWRTTLMTATGFTLVVAALVVLLAFFKSVQAACVGTGQPENVMVLNKGNLDEVLSQIDTLTARQIEIMPGVELDENNRPLISRELFIVVTGNDDNRGQPTLLTVRGVTPNAWKVHSKVRMIAGRNVIAGQGEVIVGKGCQWEQKLALGDSLSIGQQSWQVVGVFDAEGSTFESEIWGDLDELASYFRRTGSYSSVVLRTANADVSRRVVEELNNSRRIAVDSQLESAYYDRQANQLEAVRNGALVVVVFMAIGAVFGVTNTMFAAIGQRIKDIAVMRLMGFERGEILLSFLVETLLIAFVGGAIGCLMGLALNGLTLTAEVGGKSIAFTFHVDRITLMFAALATLLMGLIGGLLPAYSAMRVSPLESLR